jgi:predicted RNA-binding Zn ribbon-like protein
MSTRYTDAVATTRADPALRFDAGTPWLDLLATVGSAYGPEPTERLRGVSELERWLAHERLTPQEPPTEADVAAARAMREVLRPVVLAVLADQEVDAAALEALQHWLDRDEPLRVVPDAGMPAVEAPRTATVALARVCRQAVEHLAGPERAQLGACADDACHMAFLDPTGRRRWCAAERCGVRARVRAHRAKVRGARDG